MYSSTNKKSQKLFTVFNELNSISKAIIIYGSRISLTLLVVTSVIFFVNYFSISPNLNIFNTTTDIIKMSYTLLAISIIGGLTVDYLSRNA